MADGWVLHSQCVGYWAGEGVVISLWDESRWGGRKDMDGYVVGWLGKLVVRRVLEGRYDVSKDLMALLIMYC